MCQAILYDETCNDLLCYDTGQTGNDYWNDRRSWAGVFAALHKQNCPEDLHNLLFHGYTAEHNCTQVEKE